MDAKISGQKIDYKQNIYIVSQVSPSRCLQAQEKNRIFTMENQQMLP